MNDTIVIDEGRRFSQLLAFSRDSLVLMLCCTHPCFVRSANCDSGGQAEGYLEGSWLL
jgi:hypothetical protein